MALRRRLEVVGFRWSEHSVEALRLVDGDSGGIFVKFSIASRYSGPTAHRSWCCCR